MRPSPSHWTGPPRIRYRWGWLQGIRSRLAGPVCDRSGVNARRLRGAFVVGAFLWFTKAVGCTLGWIRRRFPLSTICGRHRGRVGMGSRLHRALLREMCRCSSRRIGRDARREIALWVGEAPWRCGQRARNLCSWSGPNALCCGLALSAAQTRPRRRIRSRAGYWGLGSGAGGLGSRTGHGGRGGRARFISSGLPGLATYNRPRR